MKIGIKSVIAVLLSTILLICLATTSWGAMNESDYERVLGQCAFVVEAEKQGMAEPKTCYQCYWIAQAASVHMKSRDGQFKAKQMMISLAKYKNY
jgi:Na+-transporting NADH:ubiquinone oxidoreductase subunit NqrB